MTIEDRLRDGLRSSAGASPDDGSPSEALWRRIERDVGGNRRGVGIRVATAVFALVIAAGGFVWLVVAFSGGTRPVTPPRIQLSVTGVRVFGVKDVSKIYGMVTNRGGAPAGASITCTVLDAAGHGLTTAATSVSYLAPGTTQKFVTQASFRGTAASADCRATPAPAVSPAPIPPVVRLFQPAEVSFWDGQRGLVAGQFGPTDQSSGVSRVEVTADGGRTWRVVLRSRTPFSDVQTLGTDLAWAVTGSCAMGTCDRALLASADGGVTWTRIFTGPLERMSFVSATDGWAVGHLFPAGAQHLEATSNGGHAWRSLPDPCPREATMATDVSFVTPSLGWLLCTGEASAGAQFRAVLETTDAGLTWHVTAEAAPGARSIGSLTSSGYPTGIVFLPDGRGWMWQQRGSLLTTNDGGRHWNQQGLVQPDVADAASPMWFAGDGTGFALRWRGTRVALLRLEPNGRWTTVATWGS